MGTKRKFVVSYLGVEREVFPSNDNVLEYKWKKQKDSLNYDKELNTKLKFINNAKVNIFDYNYFYGFERDSSLRCSELNLKIYRYCNKKYELEFEGIVPLNSGEWDLDRCTVLLQATNSTSIYDKINEFKDETKNPITNYMEVGTSGSLYNEFYLYTIIGSDVVFLEVEYLNFASYTYTVRTKPVNPAFQDYPFQFFRMLCDGVCRELLVNTGRSITDIMLRSDFFDWNAPGTTPGYFPSSTPPIPPGTTFPAGKPYVDLYLPLTPGINYVTGQTNKLTHLLYMPKSNANDVSAGEWEQPISSSTFADSQNKITFKDLEKIWATMFNAYWMIHPDGSIRVEHVSWFINNSTLYDATSLTNFPYNNAKNKYNYSKIDLPKIEIFNFSQNRDILNGAIIEPYANDYNKIEYSGVCVNNSDESGTQEKQYSIPLVVTDIAGLDSSNTNPGIYDNKGFMLIDASLSAPYSVNYNIGGGYWTGNVNATCNIETLIGVPSITTYENGHLQWANLIRRYLLDRRVLTSGDNGPDTISFTGRTIKSKTQKEILIQNCCDDIDFNPVQALVKTELGDGEIDEAIYNTQTDLITLTLLHD